MTAALGGGELGAIFINVVPSLANVMASMTSGGSAAAGAFAGAFASKSKSELADQFKDMTSSQVDAFKGFGGKAASTFMEAFKSGTAGKMPDLMASFDVFEDGIVKMVDSASLIAGIGIPFATALKVIRPFFDEVKGLGGEFTETMLEIGDSYLEASRKIAGATIDTGQIDSLTSAVRDIAASGAIVHFEDITDAIGRLNTNIKGLDLTQLKELTTTFAQAEELIGHIDPTKFAGVINAWKIPAAQADETLTRLVNTARATGIQFNELTSEMTRSGPAMRELGYDIDQTATFFSRMTQEGERGTRLIFGLNDVVKVLNGLVNAGQFKTVEEAWGSVIGAARKYMALGDQAGGLHFLERFMPPASATLVWEDIQNHVLDTVQAMKGIPGVDKPLTQAVEETKTLGEAWNAVGNQISAAVEPLGMELAHGLSGATEKVSEWLHENQGKIAGWAVDIETTFLTVMSQAAKFIADIITFNAQVLEVFKDAVVVTVSAVIQGLEPLISTLGMLPGSMGQPFRDMDKAMSSALPALDKIFDFDLAGTIRSFDAKVDNFADNVIPHFNDKMRAGVKDFQFGQDIEKAFEGNVGGKMTNIFQPARDAAGNFSTSAIGAKLLGDPQQWAETREKLHQLGIDIQTDQAGVVTAINFANEQAHKTWMGWYSEQAKNPKQLPVTIKPQTADGTPISDSGDIVPPGTTSVTVGPGGIPQPAYPGPGQPGFPVSTFAPGAFPSPPSPGQAGVAAPYAPPTGSGPQGGDLQGWLAGRLAQLGFSPDQIRGLLAVNKVEGGDVHPESILGLTESQGAGREGHVQAFMKQWNDPTRRGPGGSIPGMDAGGRVTDWDAFMSWLQVKILGQTGVASDWQGNRQPDPQDYHNRLMGALGGGSQTPAGPVSPGPTGEQHDPVYIAPAPGAFPSPSPSPYPLPSPNTFPGTGALPGPPPTSGHGTTRGAVPGPQHRAQSDDDNWGIQVPAPAPAASPVWNPQTRRWEINGNPAPPPAPTPTSGGGSLLPWLNTPYISGLPGMPPTLTGTPGASGPVPAFTIPGLPGFTGTDSPSIALPPSDGSHPAFPPRIDSRGGYAKGGSASWFGATPAEPHTNETSEIAEHFAKHFQTGGSPIVQGNWTPGKDSVPSMLEVGEYVVRRNQAQKYRPLLDAINYGVRGFAGGGSVDTTGAQVDTIAVGEAAQQLFGIGTEYMYRAPDGPDEHSSGEAVDLMVGDNKALGDQLKNYFLANAQQFGVQYVLWQQRQWNPDGSSSGMDDRGSPTNNHMDHTHVRTLGGGYPPGGGPGPHGAGQPSSGATSSTPAPAAAALGMGGGFPSAPQLAGGTGSSSVFPGNGRSGGGAGPAGGYPLGQSIDGSPLPPVPVGGLTMEQYRSYAEQTTKYTREGTDLQNQLGDATTGYNAKLAAQQTLQSQYNDAVAAYNKVLAVQGEALAKTSEEWKKLGEVEGKLSSANRELADAQIRLDGVRGRISDRDIKGTPEAPKPKGVKEDKDAATLGAGLIKGLFQGLGFPDVFGKAITEWGLWKLGAGIAGEGLSVLGAIAGEPAAGGGGGGGGGGGAAGNFLGSALAGIPSALGVPNGPHGQSPLFSLAPGATPNVAAGQSPASTAPAPAAPAAPNTTGHPSIFSLTPGTAPNTAPSGVHKSVVPNVAKPASFGAGEHWVHPLGNLSPGRNRFDAGGDHDLHMASAGDMVAGSGFNKLAHAGVNYLMGLVPGSKSDQIVDGSGGPDEYSHTGLKGTADRYMFGTGSGDHMSPRTPDDGGGTEQHQHSTLSVQNVYQGFNPTPAHEDIVKSIANGPNATSFHTSMIPASIGT